MASRWAWSNVATELAKELFVRVCLFQKFAASMDRDKPNFVSRTDMIAGAKFGFKTGVVYSIVALVIYAINGERPFERNGTTLGIAILFYLASGVIAGGLAGGLKPLATRSTIAAYLVGILAAAPVSIGALIAIGKFPPRDTIDWIILGTFTFFLAIAGVRVLGKPLSDNDTR